jgi:hypothetical protein
MLSSKIFRLFFLLQVLSCSPTKEKICPAYELRNSYSNENFGFSVELPEDYILNEDYGVLNLGAVKETPDTAYFEAFGVTVENNLLNYRLNEFYKSSFENDKADYIEQYGRVVVLGQDKLIVNETDAYRSTFAYANEISLNYYFISNGKTYKVIFLSNENDFDSLACKFEAIVKTMTFF